MDTDSGMRVLCDAIGIGSTFSPLHLPTASAPIPIQQQQQQQQETFPAGQQSQPSQPGPAHHCRICNRTYERADHLSRHLKSHENARPFKCDQCAKSFNRADLLTRHRTSHDRNAHGSSRIERADRASAACSACVASKAKCQDQKPCARCLKKGILCEMSGSKTRRYSSASSRNDGARDETGAQNMPNNHISPTLSNGNVGHDGSHIYSNIMTDTTDFEQSLEYNRNMNPKQSEVQISGLTYHNGADILPATAAPYFDDSFNSFSFTGANCASNFNQDFAFGYQDLDFSLSNIDLEGVEFAYQNINSNTPEDSNQQVQRPSVRRGKEVSRRHAAFERSPWLYRPTASDHALSDQAELHLDEESIPSSLTPSSPEANLAEFAPCCIDSKTRDRMLALLFTMQRKAPNQAPSFPSLAMVNNIIQVFFVQEKYQIDSLIHVGTFEPAKALPHLLIAIVASGSSSISVPAIWKMGLALQEVVRHTITDLWEHNNSTVRNLEALQAFMLCLDVGLWSGFKRKMEIAESMSQPIVIMLRRGGYFGAHRAYYTSMPEPDESGDGLESKWRKWAEAESYKRLIIHLFIHDIHASISMQKPPLIYFTELKFPIPASRDLWHAATAIEWRNLYHSKPKPSSETLNFMDAMQNIDLLESHSEHIDSRIGSATILNGFWAQIWAHGQSKLFYPESKTTHHLSLITEHRELYRDISEISARLPVLTWISPEGVLISELFMMILHASPDELQRFAGKYGEDEAKQATATFRAWVLTTDARTAIWHAGQVFRAAGHLAPARLRGFNVIAVYYASLTLWVYGLMSSSSSSSPSLPSNPIHQLPTPNSFIKKPATRVILNEAETATSRAFLSTNEGIPGLSVMTGIDKRESSFVPLEATDRILGMAREIYRNNFTTQEEALPPLVESMGNLLRDLSSLPSSRERTEG